MFYQTWVVQQTLPCADIVSSPHIISQSKTLSKQYIGMEKAGVGNVSCLRKYPS
jgi:hypothetical protein